MGFQLAPDNLENLPDHTDEIEKLDAAGPVDAVLPRHLGNDERGRFVIGFVLVAGGTLYGKSLTEADGTYNFETVTQTKLDYPVEAYGDVWNRTLVFQWSDRMNAERVDLHLKTYGQQFSLGIDVSSAEIEEVVEGTIEEMNTAETKVACSTHPASVSATVEEFDIEFTRCPDCGQPQGIIDDSTQYDTADILSVDWLNDTNTETAATSQKITPVTDDSSRSTRIALHYATWLGRWETDDFDIYIQGEQALLYTEGDSIAGYLLWHRLPDDTMFLQQIYVRPSYRGDGIASELLNHWYETYVNEQTYYALRPNEAGEKFLREAGHLNSPDESRAIPVTSMSANDQLGDPEEIEPAAAIEARLD